MCHRLNTDIEERPPRMRLRHQNSIESSNSNLPLATFFKNSEKSKSPPRLYDALPYLNFSPTNL